MNQICPCDKADMMGYNIRDLATSSYFKRIKECVQTYLNEISITASASSKLE